jgi:hypothetical protein
MTEWVKVSVGDVVATSPSGYGHTKVISIRRDNSTGVVYIKGEPLMPWVQA